MIHKICSLILFSIINFSCRNNSPISTQEHTLNISQTTEYKNVVFQRCLFLGLHRSKEVSAFLKSDRSTHQDFRYGLQQYQFIDSMVQPIILQAQIDSAKFYQKHLVGRNEIEQNELNGLPILKYCLAFYSSEELENIANQKVDEMNNLIGK